MGAAALRAAVGYSLSQLASDLDAVDPWQDICLVARRVPAGRTPARAAECTARSDRYRHKVGGAPTPAMPPIQCPRQQGALAAEPYCGSSRGRRLTQAECRLEC